jgi:flagellin
VNIIGQRLRESIEGELTFRGVYDANNPIETDVMPGSFKLPTSYDVSFNNLGYADSVRNSEANSVGTWTGDLFNLSAATLAMYNGIGSSATKGYISYTIGSDETPVNVGIDYDDSASTIGYKLRNSIEGELTLRGVYDDTSNPILSYSEHISTRPMVPFGYANSFPGTFILPTAYEVSFKGLDGSNDGRVSSTSSASASSSSSSSTGDPVASITGLNLTVDGQAAADGSLVLEFDSGAAITISLNGTDTADEIATTIAAAVNGAAGVGTATATGSDVAFDFTSATGDYSTATAITIGAATDVAQAVAEDDSSGTDSASDSGTDSASESSSGSGGASFVVKGAPVASISENTLTVDGVAAAAGDLVLTIAGGADATVTLDGTETGLEIATAIAGAVNGLTSGPAATDNGDGTVTFDFSAVAGDYANATKVSIDYTATTARQELSGAADNARSAIEMIDGAIQKVNIQRSKLGAVSNRLSHTINNLTNISSNLSAAQGGIEDADFAKETTDLAKNQILQQASTAMLAQANASKQNVLSLLQG